MAVDTEEGSVFDQLTAPREDADTDAGNTDEGNTDTDSENNEDTGEAGDEHTGDTENSGEAEGAAGSEQAGEGEGEGTPETFQVKVNGEMQDVTMDDLTKNYSLGVAAQGKMQEAAHLHKQATEFIKALKSNPLSILTDERLGLNFDEVVAAYTEQKTAYEGMSPEQRELQASQRRLAQFEADKKARDAQDQETFLAQQAAQVTQQIDSAIEVAGLPNNTFVFNRYIEYMTTAGEKGIEVTPAALSQLVQEDYQEAICKTAPADLINLLGDKVKDIRKYEVDNLKNDNRAADKKDTGKKPTKQKVDDSPKSLEDFKDSLGIFG